MLKFVIITALVSVAAWSAIRHRARADRLAFEVDALRAALRARRDAAGGFRAARRLVREGPPC